jgi:hypothetical protein
MLTRPRRPGMAHLNSSTLLSPCEDTLLCGDEESGTRFGGRVADPCLLEGMSDSALYRRMGSPGAHERVRRFWVSGARCSIYIRGPAVGWIHDW